MLAAVVREDWGRLLALLVARHRRLELAEDALGGAVEAAARTWGAGTGPVPDNPSAWLLTAARRRAVDRLRAEAVAARRHRLLVLEAGLADRAQRVLADGGTDGPGGRGVVDERLRLVLLCAHPRLAPEAAAALTLRLVMGVATEDVARLFLVSTPTMAARLTRARARLAGERFEVPVGTELVNRVATAAEVAYLAFTAAYAPGSGADVVRSEEAAEAVRLVRVLREVVPAGATGSAADLDALLALVLLQHSRRDARVRAGRLVLLPDQDRTRWHHDEIAEALALLVPLARSAPSTPWLLQALIAAHHAVASRAEDTDWPRIAGWYAELDALAGSPVVRLNRAVAVAEADGPAAGLELLDGLAGADLPGHRLPGVRAELLARLGDREGARAAYDSAIRLCGQDAERSHLEERLAALGEPR